MPVGPVLEVSKKNKSVCAPKKGKIFLESVGFCGMVLQNGTEFPTLGKMGAL